MLPRPAALVAALLGLLALPAAAGANPSVSVDIVTSSNLSRVPATVVHRLSLTAGATDETVRVTARGTSMEVSGSAVVTDNATVPGESVAMCPGRWTRFHRAIERNTYRSGFRIPAGTTAQVIVPVRASAAPYWDEDLSVEFEVQVEENTPGYTIRSDAPGWSGPAVPEMSLFVLRGASRTTVLTGQAAGPDEGRVEIWAFPPGRSSKARRLKTVRVDSQGYWSWAGWRPRVTGKWELYARYRRSATSPRTGATECGVTFTVGR